MNLFDVSEILLENLPFCHLLSKLTFIDLQSLKHLEAVVEIRRDLHFIYIVISVEIY